MEYILGLIVIIVICKILGISNFALLLGGVGILELLVIAMALFFVYFNIHLLLARTKKAKFSRIDIPEGSRFRVAHYIIDDVEYPCVFPKESAFNEQLYKDDKLYTVRYSKLLNKVFDKWAISTCLVGLIFSGTIVWLSIQIISASGLF